jgi:dethiobiotin synthetase
MQYIAAKQESDAAVLCQFTTERIHRKRKLPYTLRSPLLPSFLRRLESYHLVRGTPKEQVHAN